MLATIQTGRSSRHISCIPLIICSSYQIHCAKTRQGLASCKSQCKYMYDRLKLRCKLVDKGFGTYLGNSKLVELDHWCPFVLFFFQRVNSYSHHGKECLKKTKVSIQTSRYCPLMVAMWGKILDGQYSFLTLEKAMAEELENGWKGWLRSMV